MIIINDGSSDNTEKIIQSYSDLRIKYIRHEANKGLIYSRNRLINEASGEYIAFLDSDDMAMPERLKYQVKFLDKHPDYALCGTWSLKVNSEGEIIGKINMSDTYEDIRCTLLFTNSFVQSSIMIRRSVLIENPYDKEFPLAEDYELWCRLSRKYKLANIPYHMTKYRWHETNISKAKQDELLKLTKKIYKRELSLIGINASDNELSVHAAIGDKTLTGLSKNSYLSELKVWIRKLTAAAIKSELYDKNTIKATAAFRWIFACRNRGSFKALLFPIMIDWTSL